MSAEFFENMEKMKQIIDRVKFLEGSHPILYTKFLEESDNILKTLEVFEKNILTELKKTYATKKTLKNKRK